MASAIDTPSLSVAPSSICGVNPPVSERLPRQPTKRDSSSWNETTSTGRSAVALSAASARATSSA
jgi:hypothetical protein